MTHTFEPLEPYNIDPQDRSTRGRLIHAARRGDPRAKLTLRNLDRADREAAEAAAAAEDDQDPPPSRVADGRHLHNLRKRGPGWDRQDEHADPAEGGDQ